MPEAADVASVQARPTVRHGWRPSPGVASILLALPALLVLLPVIVVVWRAGHPAGDAWQHLIDNRLGSYIWQSMVLVGLVTTLATIFGVPAAWIISAHDFPGRRLFEWMLLVPLAMPAFVAAVAYVDLLEGLIPFYVWIRQHHGIDAFLLSQKVAPWVFAIVVLGSTLFPYVFLSCRAVFAREAAAPLEAARILGAGRIRTFFRVAVPLARPAIVAGASLVAMETINDYGVVSYFGITTFTPGIFRAWTEGFPVVAMRLAVVLMVAVMLGLAIERWQRGRRNFAVESTRGNLSRRNLGPVGILVAWIVCGLPLFLGFALPAWRLCRWAAQSMRTEEWPAHLSAAGTSFSLAAGAAVLITSGAVMTVAGARAFPSRLLPIAQRIGLLGYAFPSALVAVGVGAIIAGLVSGRPWLSAVALSGSAFGLMLAYFIRFLAVGIQPIAAGFERVPDGFHHAARTLGAGPLRTLRQIDLPLAWPALLAGATLVFVDVFKELPLTLILRPFDFETLATRTFRLTDEGRIPEAALPGLFMVLISLIGMIPLTRMLRHAAK
jgi:iron(III) transport system permease protein